MFEQRDAIVRLLQDNDPETVRMVKEQLALGGEDYLPELRDLAKTDNGFVSVHVKEVLAEIASHGADEEFLLLCHFFNETSNFQ